MKGVAVGQPYAVGTTLSSRKRATVVSKSGRRGYWSVEWADGGREEVSSHQMVSLWADHEVVLARYKENMAKRLTWEQLQGGASCPGCQRPLRDSRPHRFGLAVEVLRRGVREPVAGSTREAERGIELALGAGELLRNTGDGWVTTAAGAEGLRLHVEDTNWAAHHADALDMHERAGSWRLEHGPIHCGFCCPPPPLSPEQSARVLELLRSTRRQGRGAPPATEPPMPTVKVSREQRERLSRLGEARGVRAEQVLEELLTAAERSAPSGDHRPPC
jgi:hypothetical protein